MILKNTDKEWLDVKDPVMRILKLFVTMTLESYRNQWHHEGVNKWNFEIMEHDADNFYRVQVLAGISFVTLYNLEVEKYPNDTEDQSTQKKIQVWKSIAIEAMLAGMVHSYQTAVQIARNQTDGFHFTHVMGNNPLTVEEAKLKELSLKKGLEVHEKYHSGIDSYEPGSASGSLGAEF